MTFRLVGDVSVKRPRKRQQHAVFVGVEGDRKLDRPARVTHALKAAVGRGIGAPAGHPGDIELAVLGIEPASVSAREKVAGQRDGRSLGLAVDLFAQHEKMRARSIGEMDQLALQRAESAVGDGHLGTAGIIQPARQVHQREIRRSIVLGPGITVMAAGANLADHRRRHPFPLGIGDGHRAVGGQAEAVGIAKAGRHDFVRAAVGRDPQQPRLARGRVETAGGVALEAADEVVAAGRRRVGVGEALIKIGLAVAIQVVQPRDLVAAEHIRLAVGDDEAQGLVQARGKALPAHFFERLVEPLDAPDVSLDRAEQGRAVGKEVVVAEEEQGVPGVVYRRLDRVDHVRPRAGAAQLPLVVNTCGHCAGPPCVDAASGCSSTGATTRVNWPFSTQGASSSSTSPIR